MGKGSRWNSHAGAPQGRAAEEISGLAEELGVDLVVVGSRRVGTVKRLTTGSVSEGVAHLADCPVLVVRGGEADDESARSSDAARAESRAAAGVPPMP